MINALLIDRVPVVSSAENAAAGKLSVLDGVSITSGRTNPVDHPEPSSMSATLITNSEETAKEWLHRIQTGTRIDLESRIELESAPVEPFTLSHNLMQIPGGASFLNGNYTAVNGSNIVYISTAPFEPVNGNPLAWSISNPKLPQGAKIRVDCEITVPRFWPRIYLGLIAMPAPWVGGHTTAWLTPRVTNRGAVTVYRFTQTVSMPGNGHPALQVYLYPGKWSDYPAGAWKSQGSTWAAAGIAQFSPAITIGNLGAVSRKVTAFNGFIDSWTAKRAGKQVQITVTAVDVLAILSRRMISEPTRGAETVKDRINWVLESANLPLKVSSSALRNPMLASIDVDNRSALDLIREAASSAALSVWPIINADGTTGLFLDDADARPAGDKLIIDPDGSARLSQLHSTTLPADIVKNDSVELKQDSTTVATQAKIKWIQETLNEEGETERKSMTVLTGEPGSAILEVSTGLTSAADAVATGDAWLRRTPATGWTIHGVSFNTRRAPGNLVAALMNLNTRSACPITLAGFPKWTPTGLSKRMIVEGLSMRASRNEWDISLTLNRPARAGVSLTWADTPRGLTYAKTFLTWSDFAGLTL